MLNPIRLTSPPTFCGETKVDLMTTRERRYLDACAEAATANSEGAADPWKEHRGIVDELAPYDLGPKWAAFIDQPEPKGLIGTVRSWLGR